MNFTINGTVQVKGKEFFRIDDLDEGLAGLDFLANPSVLVRKDARDPDAALSRAKNIVAALNASKLSEFDGAHVDEILGSPEKYTNFSARLLRLICGADADNRRAIAQIYPKHVAAIAAWERDPLPSGTGN